MRLPKYFFYIASVLILYGWFTTFFLRYSDNIDIISTMNIVNISITLFWIIFNLIMISLTLSDKPRHYWIPIYYFILNVLNALNIHFSWISSYDTLFYISIMTKSLESIIIGRIIMTKDY